MGNEIERRNLLKRKHFFGALEHGFETWLDLLHNIVVHGCVEKKTLNLFGIVERIDVVFGVFI